MITRHFSKHFVLLTNNKDDRVFDYNKIINSNILEKWEADSLIILHNGKSIQFETLRKNDSGLNNKDYENLFTRFLINPERT